MNKDSKILNNIIRLTKKEKLIWSVKEMDGYIIYYTNYKITEKKNIYIQFENHLNTKKDFIFFEYFNKKKNIQKEIKEIFPHSKISNFNSINLNRTLRILHKHILKTKPKIV